MEKTYKKITIEKIEKILNENPIPEPKHIGSGVYEFSSGDFVVRGNEQFFNDVDKELLKMLKKNKL
jgi:hypothetical protein